jgi:hypothetical protein
VPLNNPAELNENFGGKLVAVKEYGGDPPATGIAKAYGEDTTPSGNDLAEMPNTEKLTLDVTVAPV